MADPKYNIHLFVRKRTDSKITNRSVNGFANYYDSEANEYLGAGIYKLDGSGNLIPFE